MGGELQSCFLYTYVVLHCVSCSTELSQTIRWIFLFLLKTQLLYYQNNKTKNLWYSRTFLIFYYVSNAIRSVYKGGNQVSISSLVSIPALSSIINNKEVYVFIVIGLTRCSRVLVENCPDIVHTTGHQQLQLHPPPHATLNYKLYGQIFENL